MGTRVVYDTLVDAAGTAAASITIRFKAATNNYNSTPGTVPVDYEYTTTTNGSGAFSVALAEGSYRVHRLAANTTDRWVFMGNIVVAMASPNTSQKLGALIDASTTEFDDFATAGDYPTLAEVNALILAGGTQGDLDPVNFSATSFSDNEIAIVNGGAWESRAFVPTSSGGRAVAINSAGDDWQVIAEQAVTGSPITVATKRGIYRMAAGDFLDVLASPSVGDYFTVVTIDDPRAASPMGRVGDASDVFNGNAGPFVIDRRGIYTFYYLGGSPDYGYLVRGAI